MKDSGVDPILLDAGDALFENYYLINGKVASSKLKAKTILESTAKMGDYIYNVGYQDLAAGFEFIREMEASYGTQYVSSNILKAFFISSLSLDSLLQGNSINQSK